MAQHIPKLSTQIIEEASSWFIDFHEGERDAADREEFTAWLRRSPEHVRAYLEISAMWEDAQALKKPGQVEIEALVARARVEQNVVPLDLPLRGEDAAEIGNQSSAAERPTPARRSRYWALAASVLVAVGAAAGAWLYEQREIYATAIGEQRSITLEDGSSVELNSRSRLKVRFTEAERRIELLEGQALFRVAKNPARPFIVRSDETSIRAVGTQFDVYRKPGGTVVTVVEGRVAVMSDRGAGSAVVPDAAMPAQLNEFLLSAGEQISITPIAVEFPKPANVATATAWTEKKLVFEETPLREVVEEFNRYNRQQLVIGDPQLYDFHITGVFPTTDSRRMLEFLKQRFGVKWTDSEEEIIITRSEQDSF